MSLNIDYSCENNHVNVHFWFYTPVHPLKTAFDGDSKDVQTDLGNYVTKITIYKHLISFTVNYLSLTIISAH